MRDKWANLWAAYRKHCAEIIAAKPHAGEREFWVRRFFRAVHKEDAALHGDRTAYRDSIEEVRHGIKPDL